MIETIVKNDGSLEPFDSAKLFKWAEWACSSVSKYVDWGKVVLTAVNGLPKVCKSSMLQDRLIDTCKDMNTWSYYKMAGRLYASQLNKKIYPNGKPTVQALHRQLIDLGLMIELGYTDEEYKAVEALIEHDRDYDSVWFGLAYINGKYAIRDATTNRVYETQQFVYMRMAMALASDETEDKLLHVENWYKYFKKKIINAPTPNYVNLGTPLRGLASCCVYTTKDTAGSLAAGDHIAYVMTCISAGIGNQLQTRTIGDPVRGGRIKHRGKLFYYKAVVAATQANMQGGRGGAATGHFSVYDPEVIDILQARNPRQTEDKRIRGMHFGMQTNKTFARLVADDLDYSTFSMRTQSDLHKSFFGDGVEFDVKYKAYVETDEAKRRSMRARDSLVTSLTEAFETGTAYLSWIDEMNRHTASKDPIISSNLCLETGFSSKGYDSVDQLYSTEFINSPDGLGEQEPEIGLCSLAAINVANVDSDAEYAEAAYYALKMIDKCIHITKYPFPHLELTAKARMNAGIGIVGLAYLMAKNQQSYMTRTGKAFIHTAAETHAWHVINASLRLGKELGNAPWMPRTKWPEGWLPIDTYCKAVDNITPNNLTRDWEGLRGDIIANKGIRNSCLMNHMPSESSSKASETTNSVYPVRDLSLIKTDDTVKIYWAAPDSDRLKYDYEMAWDVPTRDLIDDYAIIQKFTDQGISADLYRKVIDDEVIYTDEIIGDYLYMTEVGMKSRYYQNSKTSSGELQIEESCGDSCKL